MRIDRVAFRIVCEAPARERKEILSRQEVKTIGRPLRLVTAVGGAYLFYYGTNGEATAQIQYIANIFAIIGIAAVILAIFSQKLSEIRYFSKAAKEGSFPAEVSVGEGGIYIRRAGRADRPGKKSKAGGSGSDGAGGSETYVPFSGIGDIDEQEEYFKVPLRACDIPGVFLFKKDFGQGEPEAFVDFVLSKQSAL